MHFRYDDWRVNTSTTPLRLAVICASTRDGRFGPTVANWIAQSARTHPAFDVGYIDLADYPLPLHLSKRPGTQDTAQLARVTARLRIADAFLVVTPEYNHSFPRPAEEPDRLASQRMAGQAGRIHLIRRHVGRIARH